MNGFVQVFAGVFMGVFTALWLRDYAADIRKHNAHCANEARRYNAMFSNKKYPESAQKQHAEQYNWWTTKAPRLNWLFPATREDIYTEACMTRGEQQEADMIHKEWAE
ncbi:MAG TPA: hypothetical protein VGI16_00640 [Candidatus Acidoferrum sp.]